MNAALSFLNQIAKYCENQDLEHKLALLSPVTSMERRDESKIVRFRAESILSITQSEAK